MSVRRALVFSLIDRNASVVIGIVSSMILARLLTPAEIGVFSLVMVLMAFVSTWRDLGAGQYLVQERELTPQRIRAVWTMQIGLGLILCGVTLVASWLMPRFYGEPRMQPILWLLAVGFLVNPFGSLTYAWLMREMRFEALTVMRMSGALASAVIAALCAWHGLGAISLAFGNLGSAVAIALVSLLFRPRGFPLLPGFSEVPRVLRFGVRMTSSSLIETAAAGTPELVLGKAQDMASVGYFSRANGLISLFARLVTDAVASVATPLFAKQQREGGDLGPVFLRANAYVTVVGWSFAVFVGLMAEPIVLLLYGGQWMRSVDLTRVLALAMAAAMPGALCFQLLLGAGHSERLPRTVLAANAGSMLLAVLGAMHSLEAMAGGLVIGAGMGSAVWLRTAHAVLGFDRARLLKGMFGSAATAIACAVPATVTLSWAAARALPPLAQLALTGPISALAALIVLHLVRHPLASEFTAVLARVRRGAAPAAE